MSEGVEEPLVQALTLSSSTCRHPSDQASICLQWHFGTLHQTQHGQSDVSEMQVPWTSFSFPSHLMFKIKIRLLLKQIGFSQTLSQDESFPLLTSFFLLFH